ncbi:DUF4326 domain-containing protein [Mycobacterium sp. E1747]|uniref:DUF4326 domain-containing protein n=1 Tax=Mycobacterium sp. E1747 TaxID=1834128 RepID=UPI00082E43A2|nr:DUF4326 domain-containing protein [Mycobacterium sp. E1747]
MPERIQRRREKGWRMPEGAIYIGRPSRWGNPFTANMWGLQTSLDAYSDMVRGFWNPILFHDCDDQDYAIAYELRSDWLRRLNYHHPLEAVRYELRGHDLACWCPLDQPCHADVLLELANGENA